MAWRAGWTLSSPIPNRTTGHPALPGGLFVCAAYTYDALGQLIRVDDEQENATWMYTYDQGGNILSKRKYALGVTDGEPLESKTFSYGNANWRDQLTAVDGVAITYDQIGNPLNDGTWTYTWQNGRQLQKMQKSGETVEFVYNENGLLVQKTATTTGVTKYTLHGKNVVHMTQGSNELHFFYDAQNKPAVVVYNGTPYSYVKNLQGDIVAILNAAGNVVVSYVYDAWGRPISKTGSMAATLGTVQPFRYRGYVYDEETGLYYLRSRYYNPTLNRFVNADDRICIFNKLTFTNAYSYCCCTPVNTKDSSGTDAIWLLSGAGCTHVSLLIQDENGAWYYYFWGAKHPNWGGSVFYAGSSALVGSGGSSVSSGGTSASCGGSSVSSGSVASSVGVGSDVTANGGIRIYEKCPFDFSPTTLESEILTATSCTYTADGTPVANDYTFYEGVYTHAYYISGDFTASHELVNAGEWPIGSYDLLKNNCVQTSIDLLMVSKDANPQWGDLLKQLSGLRTLVHPGLITELASLPDILPQ